MAIHLPQNKGHSHKYTGTLHSYTTIIYGDGFSIPATITQPSCLPSPLPTYPIPSPQSVIQSAAGGDDSFVTVKCAMWLCECFLFWRTTANSLSVLCVSLFYVPVATCHIFCDESLTVLNILLNSCQDFPLLDTKIT